MGCSFNILCTLEAKSAYFSKKIEKRPIDITDLTKKKGVIDILNDRQMRPMFAARPWSFVLSAPHPFWGYQRKPSNNNYSIYTVYLSYIKLVTMYDKDKIAQNLHVIRHDINVAQNLRYYSGY
jgi:hypothetical protein